MSMNHPEFTMSKFLSKEDLYKAKAEYYESYAKLKETEVGVLQARIDRIHSECEYSEDASDSLMAIAEIVGVAI